METCTRILNLEQISFNNILVCSSDLKRNERGTIHLPISGLKEVICPEPCLATRAPYIIDRLGRSCCKPKRSMTFCKGDPNVDILKSFLGKDNLEDDLDVTSSHISLLNCSPPVRTNNPLVHDVKFMHRTSTLHSPSKDTHVVKHSSARVEENPSHGSFDTEKPIIRIEGFSCGGSKSNYVSAFA